MHPEEKLRALGLELPTPPTPLARYVPAKRVGNLLYVSGHGTDHYVGKVGRELTVEDGYAAARVTMLSLLATVKATLGDLGRVRGVVKLLGMVNCTDDFGATPAVINGASDLLVELWGEDGQHARSAVGMAALPGGIAVEIEAIFELAD